MKLLLRQILQFGYVQQVACNLQLTQYFMLYHRLYHCEIKQWSAQVPGLSVLHACLQLQLKLCHVQLASSPEHELQLV